MLESQAAMKRWAICLSVLLGMLACQVIPTPPPLKNALRGRYTTEPGAGATAEITGTLTETPEAIQPIGAAPPGDLPPFPQTARQAFMQSAPVAWQAGPAVEAAQVKLPAAWDQVVNPEVAAGLTERQRVLLAQQGFIVLHSQEVQFAGVRERVALRYGQPYYLTSDAAYHALHLALEEIQPALEREELLRRMLAITQATLIQIQAYQPFVQGKDLEEVRLAEAYLGVALKLFDPQASLNPELEARVQPQIAQILAGRGVEASALIPDFQDDYSAYRPTGHYAGDTALEAYFRGMSWYGRVRFPLQGAQAEAGTMHLPLLITLALRQSGAAEEWAQVDAALSYLSGPRQDPGPAEYAGLMDRAFGSGVTVVGLADASRWELFRAFALDLPSTQDHSAFAGLLVETGSQPGWRFMGQRASLDDAILQNLIYDRVGTTDQRRELPSGLDMMAVLGSRPAMQALEASGATTYAGYSDQMARLQSLALSQAPADWLSSAYGAWLYAFSSQLQAHEDLPTYPAYMRSPAWALRALNSALGSWAELKHAAVNGVRAVEPASLGSPPASGPAPGYVEPDPLVFYRLAHVATACAEGLEQLGMKGMFSAQPGPASLNTQVLGLLDLGDRLQRLGDIAARELRGETLQASDWALVQAPLGAAEAFDPGQTRIGSTLLGSTLPRFAPTVGGRFGVGELSPVPMLSTVKGSGERALQVGIGLVDRIYVLAPLGDKAVIAQGGVFSYYEFPQRGSGLLSAEQWRSALINEPPGLPTWGQALYLPDGNPVDVLAFRVGDVYRITPAGGALNVHAEPGRFTRVVHQLQPGEYVKIVDGPVQADGLTWWKLRLASPAEPVVEGWAVENQEWFERAWGQ